MNDPNRKPVIDALAALPDSTFVLILYAAKGLAQFCGETANDDPTFDRAFVRAVDDEFERLDRIQIGGGR